MWKYGGVQNPIIENDEDVKGIIRCLIGIMGDTVVDNTKCICSRLIEADECRLKGKRVIVKVKAIYEDNQDCFGPCVKKLQELISSVKKGV